MEEKTNIKKEITKKHAKLQYSQDQMLIKMKEYAKSVKHQLEEHMEYDGMNKEKINSNGKHQWCLWMQSMSMLMKEDNMVKSGATLPLKQMTAYKWCMKVGVVLNSPLHWVNDCKKDKECGVVEKRAIWWILWRS